MSLQISPQLIEKYHYWQLNRTERSEVNKQIQADFEASDFDAHFKPVISVMGGKTSEDFLAPKAKEILEALNEKAWDMIHVQPWKKQLPHITHLTYLLSLGGYASRVGSVLPAGMSLLYFRSQKILALANACSAYALWVLSTVFFKSSDAWDLHGGIIKNLKRDNYPEFLSAIDTSYQELKKTSWITHLYFNAHERRMKPEFVGQKLLQEQLDAFRHLKGLLLCALSGPANSATSADLPKIKAFFQRFEKYCSSAKKHSLGIGMLGMAWAYYAYVQRAYLMVMAGLASCTVSCVFAQQLFVLQRGSKKIYTAADDQMEGVFQEMASKSFLLRRLQAQKASAAQIEQAVVIPFDAILNLIPAWKEKPLVK